MHQAEPGLGADAVPGFASPQADRGERGLDGIGGSDRHAAADRCVRGSGLARKRDRTATIAIALFAALDCQDQGFCSRFVSIWLRW